MTTIGEHAGASDGHTVSSGSVPHLDGLILTARSNTLAIGRPGHSTHPIRMTTIGQDMLERSSRAVFHLPYLDRLIVAARGNVCTIRRPRQCPRPSIRFSRVAIGEHATRHTIDRAPHLHGAIKGTRGDISPIGRPYHSQY